MKRLILLLFTTLTLISCMSTHDLERSATNEKITQTNTKSIEEEEEQNTLELKDLMIENELKIQDVENTVVYIDKPVYIPEYKSDKSLEKGNLTGKEATTDSLKRATKKPEQYKQGTFYYQYNENLVYEVYAQPFHLTDIILEEGEIVQGKPLFSEDDSVWELTAGVAKNPFTDGDIQHLFVKPAYSGLDSSLIIITDRRVYHFRVKSYKDTHMAMVKFTYPEQYNRWVRKQNAQGERSVENDFIRVSNPEYISFDYKMKYSMYKKPEFLPTRVYDDGQRTYIHVDDIVLNKKLPVLFNERNEIENYSVKKNIFVIPRLINKVTLRLGREKVIIEKKKVSEKKAQKIIESKTKPTPQQEAQTTQQTPPPKPTQIEADTQKLVNEVQKEKETK